MQAAACATNLAGLITTGVRPRSQAVYSGSTTCSGCLHIVGCDWPRRRDRASPRGAPAGTLPARHQSSHVNHGCPQLQVGAVEDPAVGCRDRSMHRTTGGDDHERTRRSSPAHPACRHPSPANYDCRKRSPRSRLATRTSLSFTRRAAGLVLHHRSGPEDPTFRRLEHFLHCRQPRLRHGILDEAPLSPRPSPPT